MRIRRRIVWGLLLLVSLGVVGTVGGLYASGYRAYVIHTGSMVPDLVPGDLIIDRPADGHYRVGDVITFRHGPTPDLVTHRITQVTSYGIHTKGDANPTADVWTIPRPYVEGVVRWTLPGVGYAIVFLKQPTGFASIVVMLIGLVLLWQLFFPAEPQPDPQASPAESEPGAAAGRDRPTTDQEDEPTVNQPAGSSATPGPGCHDSGARDRDHLDDRTGDTSRPDGGRHAVAAVPGG